MNTKHIDALGNIDYWVKTGAIDFDTAKKMAAPHIAAINEKCVEIAKKHGLKPRKVGFHKFVR